jgi:hypothetical protein
LAAIATEYHLFLTILTIYDRLRKISVYFSRFGRTPPFLIIYSIYGRLRKISVNLSSFGGDRHR